MAPWDALGVVYPAGVSGLDPIEAKRRRMAEALQRKRSRQVARPRVEVVVLVKPNLRRIRQLQREAAARPSPSELQTPPARSPEEEIRQRLSEARQRLLEG